MSGQNRSSAVMAQRAESHDSLDFFPTPPWATRALCEWLELTGKVNIAVKSAWDPACGEGDMVRPLAEYFGRARGTDIFDYGSAWQDGQADFLFAGHAEQAFGHGEVDWIITNPPFRQGVDFAFQALSTAREGVALLVRTAFLEGAERCLGLFAKCPPAAVLQFSERVIMAKGRLRDPGVPYLCAETGKVKRPSTATAYCWIIWRADHRGSTVLDWIAPCRSQLEVAGDYPALPDHELPHVDAGSLI